MNNSFVTILTHLKMPIVFFSSASLFCKCFHFDTIQWNRSTGMLVEIFNSLYNDLKIRIRSSMVVETISTEKIIYKLCG